MRVDSTITTTTTLKNFPIGNGVFCDDDEDDNDNDNDTIMYVDSEGNDNEDLVGMKIRIHPNKKEISTCFIGIDISIINSIE